MKTQINYFTLFFIAVSLCIGSCGKIEEVGLENPSEEVGFLNLKAQLEKEIYVSPTGKPPTLDAILDDLRVEIYSEDVSLGSYLLSISSNYRDLPAVIELPSGTHVINLYTSDFTANTFGSRFDNADYGWHGSFTISAGNNTEVNATLNLLDTAITIDFTDELLTEYPDITVNATITYDINGFNESQVWAAPEDERTAYYNMTELFLFVGAGYDALLPLDGTLSIEVLAGAGFVTREYNNVNPNEHYRVTVSYSGDTSATIVVTLGDEIIIEDEIPFPG